MGKNNWVIIIITYIIIIFSSQFFAFVYWKDFTGGLDQLYYVVYLIILVLAIFARGRIKGELEYGGIVAGIFLVSFLCGITIIVRGTGLRSELPFFLIPMAILLYYPYVAYNVKESSLIKCLTYMGLVVFFIQVTQNIFPNSAVFGIIDPDSDNFYVTELASQRNGIWRYILPTCQISVFCMSFWYTKLLEKRSAKNWIMFLVFAASSYLYLTRQIIFAAIVGIMLFSILGRSNGKRFSKWVPFVFVIAIVVFFVPLLGELVEMTEEGGVSRDYRLEAYTFYGEKIIEDFNSFFFGCGHPASLSDWQEMHLHTSDIGFVGEVYHKGVFYLFIYFVLVYKILFKNWRTTPSYVRLYVLCSFLHSIMAFPYRSGLEFVVWAVAIYLSEMGNRMAKFSVDIT